MFSFGLLRPRLVLRKFFFIYKCDKYSFSVHRKGLDNSVNLKNPNIAQTPSKNEASNKQSETEKDKLLFTYENPKFYKMLNIFAFVQFLFWVQMSEFAFTKLKDIKLPDSKDLPWYRQINFQDSKIRTAFSGVSFLLGYGVLAAAWLFTLRSVRLLVLMKDRRTLCIATYGPFGKNKYLDVPLEKVTTDQTRENAKQYLSIKVQGKWFYYTLDVKNGTFHNPELFDYSAGMKRTFKN